MKKNFSIIIVLILFAFAACAGKKQLGSKTGTTKSKVKIDYVKMRRTACFGRCPMYNIEVYENGTVRYTGERFVKDSGIYEKNIGAAKAAEILNEFEQYRIDTCSETYESLIADLPGIYYNFNVNGEEQKIANAHFGPDFLKALARKMDEIAKVDGSWKKISSSAKQN